MAKNSTSKQQAMAREIGQLRAALANRDKSIAHYRALLGERTKALHAAEKACRKLRRDLVKDVDSRISQLSPEQIEELLARIQ